MDSETTWYLEMTSAADLTPAQRSDDLQVRQLMQPLPQFNKFLWLAVGTPWQWSGRAQWSDEQWEELSVQANVQTWVGYVDGTPVGFYDLRTIDNEVELLYFGLLPQFIGRGYGGHLLSDAISKAWAQQPKRVWVHTCSLDSPHALSNYEKRGFRIYDEKTSPAIETLALEVDSQFVSARLHRPSVVNGHAILFIHGWRSNQDSPRPFAKALSDKGFTCLTFDLRGGGRSEGNAEVLSRADYLGDCLAAFDALAAVHGVTNVSVVGSSFGSYLACLVAGRRDVASLVLRVPANYANASFNDSHARGADVLDRLGHEAQQIQYEDSYAITDLGAYTGATLVVQSGDDAIVSPSTVATYLKASGPNTAHITMDGAPHSLKTPELQATYSKILQDWFTKLVS